MKNKQSVLNIIAGSIILGLVGAYLNTLHNLSFLDTFAGYSVISFVIMLFLISFVPSRKQKSKADNRKNSKSSTGSRKPKKSTVSGSEQPQVDTAHDDRLSGHIKWYDPRKGFGFLVYDKQEIFFHRQTIRSRGHDFQENDPILFYLGESEKGPQATAIWYNDKQ